MIKRTLMLVDAQNILIWFEEFKKEKIKCLPIKIQWRILSGVKELQPTVQKFEEFRESIIQSLQIEYFNDEKSEIIEREKVDDNGATIIGDDGNPEVESIRKVKDEYFKEYENKVEEINKEIRELLIENTTYKFKEIDLDEIIENIDDDSEIGLEDIEMMSFIDINNADTE